jgi:hypothetical protein
MQKEALSRLIICLVLDGLFSENTEEKLSVHCPTCDMTAHNYCAGVGEDEYV